jgi:hypothetical protein
MSAQHPPKRKFDYKPLFRSVQNPIKKPKKKKKSIWIWRAGKLKVFFFATTTFFVFGVTWLVGL